MIHCQGCRFWNRYNDLGGLCQRHAPVLIVEDREDGYGVIRKVERIAFPATAATDWCGDAQPKE